MYSNKLKFYRKQLGLTLLQLAEKTGLSVGYLCHLEVGSRSNPSMDTMERIATVIGKTVPQIFFGDDIDDNANQ